MANEVRVTNDLATRDDLKHTNAILDSINGSLFWIAVFLFALLITVVVGLVHFW